MISFLLLTVITIYSVYGQHGPGGSFFIEEDPDTIIVEVQARGNLNANETLEYLKEVEKYQKKNRLSFTKAVERMCLEKHPEHNQFIALAKVKRLKPKLILTRLMFLFYSGVQPQD